MPPNTRSTTKFHLSYNGNQRHFNGHEQVEDFLFTLHYRKLILVETIGHIGIYRRVERKDFRFNISVLNVLKRLYESGINLVFLNEPLINTSVFENSKCNLLSISIETGNEAIDDYFKGNVSLINNLLMALAEEQIKSAFDQAEKEVTDLHSRISQGMREAKKNGVKIGLSKGTTLTTKKSLECIAIIKKHSKDFGGSLEDPEVIKLCGCSRNSYYKYKRELKTTA